MPDLKDNSTAPLFAFAELYLPWRSDEGLGPISFTLHGGQAALISHKLLAVLQRVYLVSMGWLEPVKGCVIWKGKCLSQDMGLAEHYRYNRDMGLVHRDAALLFGKTLYDNLMLQLLYNKKDHHRRLRRLAERVILDLKLEDYAWSMPTEELPEDERRLGLFALALAKEPSLFILERPRQFLEEDFELVWQLLEKSKKKGAAILVLDRPTEYYDETLFDVNIEIS
jgi:ABC-type ATPase involved in cell division